MANNSYYSFKYNHKYYIFYDQNTYNLKDHIVNELKTIDYELLEDYIMLLSEDDISNFNGKPFLGLMESVKNPDNSDFVNILSDEPVLELDISNVYIIDLDNNIFKIKYYDKDTICEESFSLLQ